VLYRRRFIAIYVVLAALFYGSAFWAGGLWASTSTTVTRRFERPRISSEATWKQVQANFAGKPYVSGSLTELPGFKCAGWTAGSAATDSGWVVIRCSK